MKIKKIIFTILASIIILFLKNQVYAANASISCTSTANVNQGITISVTGSAVQWNLKLIADGKVIAQNSELENYTGNKSISFSGTYTPTSVGNKTIQLTGSVTEYSNGKTTTSFPSKTINVTTAPASNGGSSSSSSSSSSSGTTSNSAALSMISTSPVDFSGFKSDKYKYYITVENSVTEIGVSAKGKNGSTYSVSGNKNLQEGTNKVTVTAKNGSSTQNYYIYVTRKTANNEEVIPNEIDEETEEEEKQALRLENLVLDDTLNVKLDPNFDPEVFEYTVILGNDYLNLEELYINAIPNIDGANITIEGNKNLIDGENIVTVIVEAEGYETVKYTIKVIKGPVEEVEETVAEVISTDEDILDNSEEILKKRIIICVLTLLIALIGIIFIAKECYESTNNTQNKEDNKKEKRAKKSYENDELFEDNYNEEIEFEENNILADIYNKNKSKETENEVKEEAEEIEKNEEDKEDETIKGKTESISNEDFFNRRIDIYEEKPRRRRGKGKHC